MIFLFYIPFIILTPQILTFCQFQGSGQILGILKYSVKMNWLWYQFGYMDNWCNCPGFPHNSPLHCTDECLWNVAFNETDQPKVRGVYLHVGLSDGIRVMRSMTKYVFRITPSDLYLINKLCIIMCHCVSVWICMFDFLLHTE